MNKNATNEHSANEYSASGDSPKKYIVLGLGKSGGAAAEYLAKAGSRVEVWDDDARRLKSVPFEAHPPSAPINGDEVLVVSPGIRSKHRPHPLVKRAVAAGCALMGEVGLWLADNHIGEVIAVSGTNGKSTVAELIAHILRKDGKKAVAAGNIGKPLCGLRETSQFYALELSSYQLEIEGLRRAKVAVLLNIGTDHLEYHGSMANYIAAKARLFENATQAVIGIDDAPCRRLWRRIRAKMPTLAVSADEECDVYCRNPKTLNAFGEEFLLKFPAESLPTSPLNAAACVAAASCLGVKTERAVAAIADFKPLPHRAEPVAAYRGITFINDSKATNVEATAMALRKFASLPLFWIAGGIAKLGGFKALTASLAAVRHGFFMGKAARQLSDELGQVVSHSCFKDLQSAAAAAFSRAIAYGSPCRVLLSPACASQDQWRDFAERGNAFKRLIKKFVAAGLVAEGNGDVSQGR